MSSIAEKVLNWACQELDLVSLGYTRSLPDVNNLQNFTEGKHAKIWMYVVNHVRSRRTALKIKKVLTLKKQLEEEGENIPEPVGLNEIQLAVKKAEEKREFLECSLAVIQNRILKIDSTIKSVKENISKVKQKIAFLEIFILKYREKIISYQILHRKLIALLHILKIDWKINSGNKSHSKGPQESLLVTSNEIYYNLECLINLTSSLLKKHLNDDNEDYDILSHQLQTSTTQTLNSGLGTLDLIYFLQKISINHLDLFKNLSYQFLSTKTSRSVFEKIELDRYLCKMKWDHVQSVFNTKLMKKEISRLSAKKDALQNEIKSVINFSEDPEFQAKWDLFEKQAENEGFNSGNTYLEGILTERRKATESLSTKNELEMQKCEDLENLTNALKKRVDFVHLLMYTAPKVFQTISNKLSYSQKFIQNDFFLTASSSLQQHVLEIKDTLCLETQLMWAFSKKANVIKPLVIDPLSASDILASKSSEAFRILPFQSTRNLCKKWIEFKQTIANTDSSELAVLKNKYFSVEEKYCAIMSILKDMQKHLNENDKIIDEGFSCCNRVDTCLKEWWEQNAQFIIEIEFEGKSLKSWFDILSVL